MMPRASVIGWLSAGPGRERIMTRLQTSALVRRACSRYHMPGRPLARAGGLGCRAAGRAFTGAGLALDTGARLGGHVRHGGGSTSLGYLLAAPAGHWAAGRSAGGGGLRVPPMEGHFSLPA